jgi:hypothetical protein
MGLGMAISLGSSNDEPSTGVPSQLRVYLSVARIRPIHPPGERSAPLEPIRAANATERLQ